MKERQPVNYVYFGVLFIVLSFLHIYHVFLIDQVTGFHQFYYVLHAMGQCAIEVLSLLIISHILERVSKILSRIFIIATFLLFLAHVVDFPLLRIMGMSVWYAFDMVMAESIENFIELLYATHIPIIYWILSGVATLLIPLLGIVFFRFTHKLAQKRPVYFSSSVVGVSLFSVVIFLSMYDMKTSQIAIPSQVRHFSYALPWKTTLFPTAPNRLDVGHLARKSPENQYCSYLESIHLKPVKKPNIFLFVTESLREDYINPDVAPALSSFRKDNIAFPHALSGANATHLSWFSIFHSVYPFHWDERKPSKWKSGSLPLQILKKAGYQVHVYSASRLQFYHMDERIFGQESRVANTVQVFGQGEERESHENDSECMATLLQDLSKHPEGHVFIVFLESTHFGYSWPQQETVFPASEGLDYLRLTCFNDEIERVKNRYRNAVHFVDGLFGQFLKKLETVPGGEEAVVVFTGDHGEEFLEQGHIFHASNLSTMQTHVPLYFRLGTRTLKASREIVSHLDVFPTIIDHVLGYTMFSSWFDGESILRPSTKNFAIATRFNASRPPFEFLIHTGKEQLTARLENPSAIFKSNALEIVSRKDKKNQPLEVNPDQVKGDFKSALEVLFKN